jgi:hypothetical protein
MAEGLAAAEFRLHISEAAIIINLIIFLFEQACLKPMNRHLVPSPASPLLVRFGPRDRRKMPPVRPPQVSASKYLISMVLSRMTGSKSRPRIDDSACFGRFTGVGGNRRSALPCQRRQRSTRRHRPITSWLGLRSRTSPWRPRRAVLRSPCYPRFNHLRSRLRQYRIGIGFCAAGDLDQRLQ